MKFGSCLCLLFLAGGLPAAEIVITTNSARTNFSSPVPIPKTNAFTGIQVKRGFRLELVAAEPLVVNPGAMAFDENGRLFVLETPDGQPGRVRLLEDTDGNGVFDASRVFAENVYGATALACYGGGVFVGAGTEVLYLKDTKGTGQADDRRVIYTGFGDATNGAGGVVAFTAMVWGPDNRIHVATVGHGGDIISSSVPKQSIVLSAGCFSFDPRTFALADEAGLATAGMSFDNRGRKFVANSAGLMQMVMYESRYAMRNQFFEMPDPLLDLSANNVIYPGKPGISPPARFSTASGLTIYRGYLFPQEYVGNSFIADAAAGVVHRDRLRADGLELMAERAPDELQSEFLTVANNSFLPVALANGPEGALYVAGPAREAVILPSENNAKTNLVTQRGFGRIYRVVPVNFKQPAPVHLGQATVTNLVNLLRHSDGWHRDTAARLLYERQDKASVVPVVQLLFDPWSPPLARVYALHALDGLQRLLPGQVAHGLNDADERVREHAVLLAEKMVTNGAIFPDTIWGELMKLPGDPSPQVRYQLAFALGQCRNPGRVQALADTLRHDPESPWMQTAVLSSLNEGAGEIFGLLAADADFRRSVGGRDFLCRLAAMIGTKNQPEEVAQTMRNIAAIPEVETAFFVARKLGDGLQLGKSSLAAADAQGILRPLYLSATRFAQDMNAAEGARLQAIRMLDATGVWDPEMNAALIREWFSLTPRLQRELVNALCSQGNRTATLIYALQALLIPRAQPSTFQIKFLLAQPDEGLRRQAAAIYGNPAIPSRQNVVNQFLAAARLAGAREHGRALFAARCGDCHKSGREGNASGAVLRELQALGKEKLLQKTLDPNRELAANDSAVIVVTGNGETLAGNVVAKKANAITLCQPNGELRVIGAQNIQTQVSLGISAMPDGLEAGLSQQDMADLLEFLCPGLPPQ